jgi:cytidyltransferase-like protein
MKKVFVSGCFDLLHSGHVAFLEEAATYGQVYVCLGSDATVFDLKGRYPVYNQAERKYMVSALRSVHECRISRGSGIMDFLGEFREIRPHIFVVNEDGHTPAKEMLCRESGVEYLVLRRIPHGDLPARSTTSLRTECTIPYRIDLAGGWLDQPFVSRYAPGAVLTIAIEPSVEFHDRGGMASSTRKKAIRLWKTAIPAGDREDLAKLLFSYENPPGTKVVSGSQDAIGIVYPGLNKLNYAGEYWPSSIESTHDEDTLRWLEQHLFLISLGPRRGNYDVLEETRIDSAGAQRLADAAEKCWNAIGRRNAEGFGRYFREAFEAQTAMFPRMVDASVEAAIRTYAGLAYGWKLSGAGGGGYLILVAEGPVHGAMKITIRRASLS